MNIVLKTKSSFYFDSSADLKLLHDSLQRIISSPGSVNLTETDFTPEELETIKYLCDLTRKGSFFEMDDVNQVDNFANIVMKVKSRRRKAGFKKADFPKCELEIWDDLYRLLNIEP